MRTIFIIHGYTASPEANWFPWLAENLSEDFQVKVLRMPNPAEPSLIEWDQYLDEYIDKADVYILVGHSLGCITALRYLQRHHLSVEGALLVSGFDEELDTLPELADFTKETLDNHLLQQLIQKRTVISARNDDIVAAHYSDKLAKDLSAKFILMPEGGHFIDRDGVTSLPVALQEILLMDKEHGDQ